MAEPSPDPGEPSLEPALDLPLPGVSNPCMPVPDPLEGGLKVWVRNFSAVCILSPILFLPRISLSRSSRRFQLDISLG